GIGRIHGAIIDVDDIVLIRGKVVEGGCHLFINPNDGTITPYYAENIEKKYVYHSFPALIYDCCPKLYDNYIELLSSSDDEGIIIKPVDETALTIKPILYSNTDIYKVSREIRKMQKLKQDILTTWMPNIPGISPFPKDNEKNIIDTNKLT
ncbi:MAG: hypothetical protein K6B75_07445, partial [Lachnospiraceae bacterium]|nr:hypothetical protein [Lachnospiraceae bacterium]